MSSYDHSLEVSMTEAGSSLPGRPSCDIEQTEIAKISFDLNLNLTNPRQPNCFLEADIEQSGLPAIIIVFRPPDELDT